jgi:lipopolysaccharide/colanic/teichoic acid biosynthesis glycosyltransferase
LLKRTFDIVVSCISLIIFSPLFIIISVYILFDSTGSVFYKQERVGKNKRIFYLYKFRTMIKDASKNGLLTVGAKDSRITKPGYFLRKYKLDELPQLYNVLIGDMSIIGPRPETPNHVELYNSEQLNVLSVRPGLTEPASLEYINESEILAQYPNPHEAYINIIMPAKLNLNAKYISEQSFIKDLKLILKTVVKIVK